MDTDAWLRSLLGPAAAVHDGGLPRRRYAARAGWDTGERVLADHLIYAVQSGEAILETGGRGTILRSGQACVVPPGAAFAVRAGARPPRLLRLRLRAPRAWGSEAVVIAVTPELRRVLELLADAAPGAHGEAWDRACAGLLAVALARAAAPRVAGALPAQALEQCRAEVRRDPRATPRALARACGLSLDWFARAFRRATGRAPRRWLVEERVRLAAEAIADGAVAAWPVAQRLGWRDPKLFGRQFRTVMGEPPGRWRAQVV